MTDGARAAHAQVLTAAMSLAPAVVLGIAVAERNWVGVGLILGGSLVLLGAMARFRLLLVLWIVGTPTVFVFANKVLYPIATVLTVERVLFAVLILVGGTAVLLQRVRPIPLGAVERAMLVVLGVCGLSFLFTMPGKTPPALYGDVQMAVEALIMPFAAFVFARSQPWSGRELTRLSWVLTTMGAYLAVSGLVQYYLDVTVLLPTYLKVDPKIDRATGSFVSQVEYGAVLCLILLLTWFLYVRARDGAARALLLASMGLMVAGVAACRARAVWVALAAAVATVILARRRRRGRTASGPVIVALALALALAFLTERVRFEERALDWHPILSRIALYSTAVNLVVHNPVFGLGWNREAFKENRSEYITEMGTWAGLPAVPHNEILFMLVQTGLVGTVPYVLVFYFGYRLVRSRETADGVADEMRSELALFVRGAFLIVLLTALVSDIIAYTYFRILFFFLVGLVSAPASRAP